LKKNFTIIKAKPPWWDLELANLWQYKDLIYLLIRRDFVTSYKQTILGPIWIILQAIVGSAIFTVIFGKIANIPTDGHPTFLFYLCGMLSWQYFASVYGAGCNSLQGNLPLFSKVYFPRLIPPLSQALFLVFNLLVQLAVLFLAIYLFRLNYPEINSGPQLSAFFLPLLILQSALLGLGIGFIVSASSVKYRDLSRIAGMATQFLMYASPVIYPISEIPEQYKSFMFWNPLTFIVETYRELLLGHSTASTLECALPSVTITLIVFVFGLILYNNTQRTYVDYV
jgi:lipopolysaccharide transport system permease protein